MKKHILVLLISILPFTIQAQNINGSISSSFYTFERIDTAKSSNTFIRNYETLALNFNYKDYSLRTRANFETNIGNALDSDPRLRFYDLYLEARNIFDYFSLKLGRQPLFTAVAGGLYDGVNLKFKFENVSVTGYYGGNVPAYQQLSVTDDWKDNYVVGGKFDISFLEHFNFGLGYINKNFKPEDYYAMRLDENSNPINVLIQQNSNQFKYLSANASYFLSGLIDVNSRYEYDMNYETTSKFEIDSRVQATDKLGFDVYYNYRQPKIAYNSIFSVFNFGNTQEIDGGVDYKFTKYISAYGKFGYVQYDGDNSECFTLGANSQYGSISYRKNLGYSGELDGISIYTAHTFADGFITPSLGISFTDYKISEDAGVNHLTSLLGGINLKPWNSYSFDIQAQYFDNKIYRNDFRLLIKVNHWFNTNL